MNERTIPYEGYEFQFEDATSERDAVESAMEKMYSKGYDAQAPDWKYEPKEHYNHESGYDVVVRRV